MVLPLVVMSINADSTMTVTVDGEPHEPPPFAPPWRRESFAAILDELTGQRLASVRVEVREIDGAVFTDIIAASARRARTPEPELTPRSATPPRRAVASQPGLASLTGEGFVPGEDVAVAVIVAHTGASRDGTARSLITAEALALSQTREAILLGRVSGTFTVGHPR